MCGEKNDGNTDFSSFQFVLKVQAADAGKSLIKGLGLSLGGFDKNSCAIPKDLECNPTDSGNSWRDSHTSSSSSTMNTVGTSCVLITTRLSQNENKSQNVASWFQSSPIVWRETTPDRLYRMMQKRMSGKAST